MTIFGRKVNMGFYKSLLKFSFLTLLISVEIRGIRLSNVNSNNSAGNGGSGSKSSSRGHSNTKEQLNVGLVAPHTNFGKREYLRAINTAVQSLPKTRGTKLTFLQHYIFDQKNVIQTMMPLTPSPTSKYNLAFLCIFSSSMMVNVTDFIRDFPFLSFLPYEFCGFIPPLCFVKFSSLLIDVIQGLWVPPLFW